MSIPAIKLLDIMYLHLGRDIIVNEKDIVAIFDIDKTTIGKITKRYLYDAEKKHTVVNVSDGFPKSFIVCEVNGNTTVYISQISTVTLQKRSLAPLKL